jgi:hypothetical protein
MAVRRPFSIHRARGRSGAAGDETSGFGVFSVIGHARAKPAANTMATLGAGASSQVARLGGDVGSYHA